MSAPGVKVIKFDNGTIIRADGTPGGLVRLEVEMSSDDARGFVIDYSTFELVGDAVVIKVPNAEQHGFTPQDAKPLKRSEYWALKEGVAA